MTDTWRLRAIHAAFRALSLPVIDGTPKGEQWVRDNAIRPVWGNDKAAAYTNGSQSWCGDFLAYCWREAGLRVPAALSSVGRLLYPFARYDNRAKAGPHWCVVLGPGGERQAVTVRSVHEQADAAGATDAMRRIQSLEVDGTWGTVEPRPGDAILFQSKAGGWNGHVMMAVAQTLTHITVIDGNGSLSYGPAGDADSGGKTLYTRRDGVGVRTIDLARVRNPDRWWLVRPSEIDFSEGILSYHTSLAAAKRAAVVP